MTKEWIPFSKQLFSSTSARLSSGIDEKIIKWAIISENKVGVIIFKQKLFICGECRLKDTTLECLLIAMRQQYKQ